MFRTPSAAFSETVKISHIWINVNTKKDKIANIDDAFTLLYCE